MDYFINVNKYFSFKEKCIIWKNTFLEANQIYKSEQKSNKIIKKRTLSQITMYVFYWKCWEWLAKKQFNLIESDKKYNDLVNVYSWESFEIKTAYKKDENDISLIKNDFYNLSIKLNSNKDILMTHNVLYYHYSVLDSNKFNIEIKFISQFNWHKLYEDYTIRFNKIISELNNPYNCLWKNWKIKFLRNNFRLIKIFDIKHDFHLKNPFWFILMLIEKGANSILDINNWIDYEKTSPKKWLYWYWYKIIFKNNNE